MSTEEVDMIFVPDAGQEHVKGWKKGHLICTHCKEKVEQGLNSIANHASACYGSKVHKILEKYFAGNPAHDEVMALFTRIDNGELREVVKELSNPQKRQPRLSPRKNI